MDLARGFRQQRLDGTPRELQGSPVCRWPHGVLINRKTCLRGCEGVSVKLSGKSRENRARQPPCEAPSRRRQEVGHGHYQAQQLELTQHTGGHEKSQDLITDVQHSRTIYVHARTRHCQKSSWKSEAPKKTRKTPKEKRNQNKTQLESVFETKWVQ